MRQVGRLSGLFDRIVEVVTETISSTPPRSAGVSEKSPRDLVSAVDVALAEEIKWLISKEFPDDEIVCEEDAGSKPPTRHTAYRWMVDPIDGTTNFTCGFPFFATAVSCHRADNGKTVASLVFAPLLNQRFEAFDRDQATLNRVPISVSQTSEMQASLILTGFPSNVSATDRILRVFADASSRSRGTRRSGSAAIDICWIAAGFGDAYYHFSLSPWDVMAAGHILECSGGRVTNIGAEDFSAADRTIIASNRACHDALNRYLSEAFAKVA